MTIVLFLPFALILWLANCAEKAKSEGRTARALLALTYILILSLLAFLAFVGVTLQLIGALTPDLLAVDPSGDLRLLPPEIIAALPKMGLGLWLPSLFGMLVLLPPVRRLLSRWIPIASDNTIHAVALSYAALILAQLLATTGLGLANLIAILEVPGSAPNASLLISVFWAQELTWAFMAMVGVGLLSRRNLKQTLLRLGLLLPSARQVAVGLGIGIGLAVLANATLYVADTLGIKLAQEVERLSDLLIGPLAKSPLGIVTLGLAAAIGEESVFRGALQPRFGLVLTASLFTLLHTQYGLSLAILVVLAVGLVFGWVRQRYNTSTSMIAHATYNMAVALLALSGLFGP